jgi:hypothetical protein
MIRDENERKKIKSSFFRCGTNWNLKIRNEKSQLPLHDFFVYFCAGTYKYLKIFGSSLCCRIMQLCGFMFEIRIFKKQKKCEENNMIPHHYTKKVHPKNKNTQKIVVEVIKISRLCSIGKHTHSRLSIIIIAFGRWYLGCRKIVWSGSPTTHNIEWY